MVKKKSIGTTDPEIIEATAEFMPDNQAMVPLQDASLMGGSEAETLAKYQGLVKKFKDKKSAKNTHTTYAWAWGAFAKWCAEEKLNALPASPQVVEVYISKLAEEGCMPSTIKVTLAAIRSEHLKNKLPTPTMGENVRETLNGIRRDESHGPQDKKLALTIPQLAKMCDVCPPGPIGTRDRAMLLIGFDGAFRRSNLIDLTIGDITFPEGNVRIWIKRGKTDQQGKGRAIIMTPSEDPSICPVRAMSAWLEMLKVSVGDDKDQKIFTLTRQAKESARTSFDKGAVPVRITDKGVTSHYVACMVKARAEQAGLDAQTIADLSAHSLRAGFVTAAIKAGKRQDKIMEVTGHKDIKTLAGYMRDLDVLEGNATEGLIKR